MFPEKWKKRLYLYFRIRKKYLQKSKFYTNKRPTETFYIQWFLVSWAYICITRDPSYTKLKSTEESCIILIKNLCQSHNNPNNNTAYRQIWVVPLQLIKIYFCLMLYIRTLVINVACFTKGFVKVTSLFIETWIVTWFVTALCLCNRISLILF